MIRTFVFLLGLAALSLPATASVVTTQDESAFQGAFASYTLVNFDNAGFAPLGSTFSLADANPTLALLGLQSVGYNATVTSGQAYQIAKPGRDKLILNGVGFGGHIAFDFANDVYGVGALTNFIDYGRVRAFSGANLTGALVGEVTMAAGGFGGLISNTAIRSIEITCDFNGDYRCGVYDLQFSAVQAAVPAPAESLILMVGLVLAGMGRWLRR